MRRRLIQFLSGELGSERKEIRCSVNSRFNVGSPFKDVLRRTRGLRYLPKGSRILADHLTHSARWEIGGTLLLAALWNIAHSEVPGF